MADLQPISGTLEIDGNRYAFRGNYGPQDQSSGARLAWSADVDGLDVEPGSGLVAYPGGYQGANPRAVTCFMQDHFQGRARLRNFEARNGLSPHSMIARPD